MNKKFFIVLIALISIGAFDFSVMAMTRADTAQTKPDYDTATGFYGGIQNGKFRLILSEQGGLLFYGLPKARVVLHDGRDLLSLPKRTPIKVLTKSGTVIDVIVLEESK